MQIDYSLQNAVALWAFVLGCCLCLIYDILRVFRLGKKQNPLLLFLLDVVYCLLVSVSFSVLFFNLTFGRMRAYGFLFGAAGFWAWRLTVSRLFMLLLIKLRDAVAKFMNSLKIGVQSFITRLVRRVYTKIYCEITITRAKRGFGMYKSTRKEN